MKLSDVWKAYAPNFIAGVMTAIFISIILGYNPVRLGWFTLMSWFIGLYLFGLIMTWFLLLKFK